MSTGLITTNRINLCSISVSAILGLALMYYKSFLPPLPPLIVGVAICIPRKRWGVLFWPPWVLYIRPCMCQETKCDNRCETWRVCHYKKLQLCGYRIKDWWLKQCVKILAAVGDLLHNQESCVFNNNNYVDDDDNNNQKEFQNKELMSGKLPATIPPQRPLQNYWPCLTVIFN